MMTGIYSIANKIPQHCYVSTNQTQDDAVLLRTF